MALQTDITVKKSDGVTNVIYKAKVGAAGDNLWALWSADAEGPNRNCVPWFRMKSGFNGPKTARKVFLGFSMPQLVTDSTTTLTTVVNNIPVNMDWTLPMAAPQATWNEAVDQLCNFFAKVEVRQMLKDGYVMT